MVLLLHASAQSINPYKCINLELEFQCFLKYSFDVLTSFQHVGFYHVHQQIVKMHHACIDLVAWSLRLKPLVFRTASCAWWQSTYAGLGICENHQV